MARINLLPWREWEREKRKQEFLVNLALVLLGAGLAVFAWGWQLDGAIEQQTARNKMLTTEIAQLDEKIKEISTLRREREELLSRMRVIQDLQGNRPVIVRVFDELVRTMSKGVYYEELSMSGADLAVSGTAESNNRISSLMRNLDTSGWFQNPNLKSIKEASANSQSSRFDLTFNQVNPTADAATEE